MPKTTREISGEIAGAPMRRWYPRRLAPKILLALLFMASAVEVALAAPPVMINTGLTPQQCYRRDSQCTEFCSNAPADLRYECFDICDRMLNRCLDTGDWKDSRVDATPDEGTPPTRPPFTPIGDLSVLRLMTALADSDGNGSVSLPELGEAHAKVFKQIDANGDGQATREEIQLFFSFAPDRK
jgi:hypothetical protein